MISPWEAALRFLWGLALGGGLGVCYDVLRPLRSKRNAPADLLFVLLSFQAWLYLSFGICGGDIRMDITAALGIGALLWIHTLGKPLRPVFYGFWRLVFRIFSVFFRPIQKIIKIFPHFSKKVFAYKEKKGTIEWSSRRHIRRRSGGTSHEPVHPPQDQI